MIDHVSVAVRELARSSEFYGRILAPLGMNRLVERPNTVGFGRKYPEFWINARPTMVPVPTDTGTHICLRAPSHEAVREFHRIALALGGRDDGAPGERQAAMTTYFGAFIKDFDGNKIEAVVFPRTE